jgi:PIN domain nuclease of toxin-antitoxin system
MTCLLDTQVVLWWNTDSARLGTRAMKILQDPGARLLCSHATIWEMAIKVNIGKLRVEPDLETFVDRYIVDNSIELLPIDLQAILGTGKLEPIHQDPFDRLIISQAIAEGLPVISADVLWDRYPVRRIW